MLTRKVKVLIVDDSALIRAVLTKGLSLDPQIEVVGEAADPYLARDKIVQLKPDVLTLDIEMPKMNGVEFLQKLMPQYPIPVVMVSSLTERGKKVTFDALEAGAVDFIAKPKGNDPINVEIMLQELRTKVKIAATANVSHWKLKREDLAAKFKKHEVISSINSKYKIIAIGASTGGTEVIAKIISELPMQIPGVVIVQHMPAGFTKMFADRLNTLTQLEVKEAINNELILPGKVLIAPGGFQTSIVKIGSEFRVEVKKGELVQGHAPSVDVLFNSIASLIAKETVGVILTGMGSDGARGLKALRENGARTLGQNEASCVVYGMPKVAFELGAVEKQVGTTEISTNIINFLQGGV